MCKEAQMKIIRGHKKICTWPNNPASDDYLNPFHAEYLSPEDRDNLKQDFIERAKRIRSLGEGLPHIKLDTHSEMVWCQIVSVLIIPLNIFISSTY